MLAHKTYKIKFAWQLQCLCRLRPEEQQTERHKQANWNNQQEQQAKTATFAAVAFLLITDSFLALLIDQVIQGVVFVKDVVMTVVGHGWLSLVDEFVQGFPDCRLITLAILYFPDREFLT